MKIHSIIENDELLVDHTKKARLGNYCPNKSMEMRFMNTKNSKINEPHKFAFNLSKREDLRSLNKHIALQNVYLYKTLNYRSTKAFNSKQ